MHATSFVVTQAQTLSAFIVSRLAPFTKALKDLASDVNAARIRASSLIAMAWQKKFHWCDIDKPFARESAAVGVGEGVGGVQLEVAAAVVAVAALVR